MPLLLIKKTRCSEEQTSINVDKNCVQYCNILLKHFNALFEWVNMCKRKVESGHKKTCLATSSSMYCCRRSNAPGDCRTIMVWMKDACCSHSTIEKPYSSPHFQPTNHRDLFVRFHHLCFLDFCLVRGRRGRNKDDNNKPQGHVGSRTFL